MRDFDRARQVPIAVKFHGDSDGVADFFTDQPERLEYPTEAWAAQEFRKANVLWMAARHAEPPEQDEMLDRARQLADRAWRDLSGFESRHTTRAMAVIMVEGSRWAWRESGRCSAVPAPAVEEHDFGTAERFVTQRERIKSNLCAFATLRSLSPPR